MIIDQICCSSSICCANTFLVNILYFFSASIFSCLYYIIYIFFYFLSSLPLIHTYKLQLYLFDFLKRCTLMWESILNDKCSFIQMFRVNAMSLLNKFTPKSYEFQLEFQKFYQLFPHISILHMKHWYFVHFFKFTNPLSPSVLLQFEPIIFKCL